ncbi:MAG: hypothetical protein CSA22_03770 [Deltaproteobacteria bacterium]|nr:MAG: hypothetical protein CSA22_03770 [Deltaproteobacteria bacterium]
MSVLKKKKELYININIDWFLCHTQLTILSSLLQNNFDDEVVRISKKLMEDGWGEDKILLYFLSASQYSQGNLEASILYLEQSLKSSRYYCDIAAPLEENKSLNESEIRYILSELYLEKGLKEKSIQELRISKNLARKYFGKYFNDSIYQEYIQSNSFKNKKKISSDPNNTK